MGFERTEAKRLSGSGHRMLPEDDSFLSILLLEFRVCRIIPSVIKVHILENQIYYQIYYGYYTMKMRY